MVLNREKKEDVFAGFHLDEGVADNEESLNQLVEREQKSVLSPVDRDAFAEFNLDEIVRQTEERLRKQELDTKAKEEDEDGLIKPSSRGWESARAATSSLRGIGALRRPPQFLSQRAPIKGIGDIPSLHHLSSRLTKRDMDRNVAPGDDSGSVAPKIKPTINPKKQSTAALLPKKKKSPNASRSGTTVTAKIEEEDEMESDSDNDSLSDDDDVEKGGNIQDDDDDDDDSVIIVRRSKKQKEKDAITRSSTGMPIGGMLASSRKRASNSADASDYRWISPHKSDNIFRDFDIDAIVKDYEELHRTTQYGVPGKKGNTFNDDDDDDDEDDEQVLGIRKRYRSIKTFWLENFPRTHGVLFRIFIPLLCVSAITWFLGIQLAHFEKGQEIDSNNMAMQKSYNLTDFGEPNLYFVEDGPGACFDHYMKQKVPDYVQSYNRTDLTGFDFPAVSPGIDKDKAEDLVVELKAFMRNCTNHVNEVLTVYKDYKNREIEAASQTGMTFNWIRCWNQNDLGPVNPLYPSKRQQDAAVRQAQFFEQTWNRNQSALYDKYITQNYTKKEAEAKSVAEASGAGMCSINKPASAWFWIVFMTTVGYGNVSPVTENGRIFVALIGWITIIVWAVILYVAGRVLGIIFDDVFRRLGCRKLTGNLPSVIFWGIISTLYVVFIGEYYAGWFNSRAHPGRVRFTPFGLTKFKDVGLESTMNIKDAYWFSYISLLTVGLGDFSIGPESFFVSDLIIWTAMFLTGFTLIATFLGQIADLANAHMPDSGDELHERLLNTNLVGKKEVEYKRENQKGIEKLEKIVEIMDDDDKELLAQRVTRIRVKQNLLVHLLHQTKAELDHYKRRGERYEELSYAMVCMEENMLNDVTATTRKEREKIESYRDGTGKEALPTPGSGHSYFDEGTPVDTLAKKLKLREGVKSAKKTLKASWYV